VNVDDLRVLATNWQQSLPAPASPLFAAAINPSLSLYVRSKRLIDDVEQSFLPR
jgi:hypothetical protein